MQMCLWECVFGLGNLHISLKHISFLDPAQAKSSHEAVLSEEENLVKSCQKLPRVAKSCQKLPKVAKRSQKWPPFAKVSKGFKRMPKAAKDCQRLPKIAKSCHRLPKNSKTCQKVPKYWLELAPLGPTGSVCLRLATHQTAKNSQSYKWTDWIGWDGMESLNHLTTRAPLTERC